MRLAVAGGGETESSAAGAVIQARLGRPPQDALEAAVVLEAWGGLPAAAALRAGPRVLSSKMLPSRPQRWRSDDQEGRRAVLAEGIGLLVAILSIAALAGPLSDELGNATFERALRVALPLTLALQWALRSRYLGRRSGIACLGGDWVAVCAIALAIAGGLVAIPGWGAVAAMLAAVWVGGTVLARRGWGLAYAGLLVLATVGMLVGLPAVETLAALTGVTLLGVVIAVRTARVTGLAMPGTVGRALAAGAIGALLGILLIGDPSLGWGIHGAFPALALVPSVVGSFWGGYHLWQFHDEVPRRMRGVELSRASATMARGPATDIVLAALARLVGITLALSLVVAFIGEWTEGTDSASLFVGFGCAALVCLFVSLLESLGCVRWAMTCAIVSVAVELVVAHVLQPPVAGAGLIAGGTVGTVLAIAPLVGLLRSPGRVLATTLWIR
ncbi:MAG TPA: hypothetical protein VGM91_00775 [Conexibacter sp.]|jgi:hypothetical protein